MASLENNQDRYLSPFEIKAKMDIARITKNKELERRALEIYPHKSWSQLSPQERMSVMYPSTKTPLFGGNNATPQQIQECIRSTKSKFRRIYES